VKFLVRLGKTPTEALRIPQDVYGDDAMSRALAFERHKRFKEGREDIEDDPRRAEGLPQVGPRKMSSFSARRCMEIAAT